MQRYFVEKEDNGIFTLSNDDSYHVIKVMRMKIGDRVEIVSNRKEYITEIISMDSNVRCKIFSVNEEKVSIIPKVTVAQALVKEQKMDYILQKGTELGLDQILVYQAERSIVKMDKNDKKLDRWSKILKEASEQSKRNNIPLVWFTSLNELIASNYNHKYICSVNAIGFNHDDRTVTSTKSFTNSPNILASNTFLDNPIINLFIPSLNLV